MAASVIVTAGARRGRGAQLTLTAAQARRVAVAAQRLSGPPGPEHPARTPDRGHLRRLVDAIGLLQIDSVNVVARAHYLPVFARLGAYPTDLLDRAAWPRTGDRQLLESWAHVAALVPVDTEPLLRWRRERTMPWLRQHHGLAEDVLAVVRATGPMSAGEVERAIGAPGRLGPGWWEWSHTKRACEYLFAVGELGCAHRRGFERCYDLTERVVPRAVLARPTPEVADAKRELVARAARHHGIGTAADLADYYRLKVGDTKVALRELVEAGTVLPVAVRGWDEIAYLHADVTVPRRVTGRALLCPFDPLIFFRPRTERMFGVRYRIEIYTPAERRVHGYYVFPLLVGDRIVGRFDLKADRAASRLLVQSAWLEGAADPGETAVNAAAELHRMARWLGLDEVAVRESGDLARVLAGALGLRAMAG